jgi:hypothetical protein
MSRLFLVRRLWPVLLLAAAAGYAQSGFLWRAATGGQIRARPAVAPDGTVYALSEDSALYAWVSGGSQRWRLDLGVMPTDCLAMSPADGTVYAGLRTNDFLAVNALGGKLWSVRLDGLPAGDPSITREGTVLVGTSAGTLVALSHLGRREWAVTLPGAVTGQPAIDGAGTIYVGAADQRLYALTPWGEFKWSLPVGGVPGAPSIAPGASIVVGTAAGDLLAVSPAGEILWRRGLGAAVAGVVETGKEIVAATTAGLVAAFATDGKESWRASVPRQPVQLLAAGSDLLVTAADGTVFRLAGGTVASSYSPGTAGGVVLDAGGTLILGGRNWVVYALERAELGLPAVPGPGAAGTGAGGDDSWPQQGHDAMHSGRTNEAPPGGNDALLAQNTDYLYLSGISAAGDRDSTLVLLNEIAARIDAGSLGKSRWYVALMLEQVAGEGIIHQVRQNQRLVNDFPDLRADAASLLARVGTVGSRATLLTVVDAETDSVALAAEIRALGSIASDGDGASARAIARAFQRRSVQGADRRLASAVVEALGRISVYEGALGESSAALALLAIARGPYDAGTREAALAVLQGEPKVDILDVEE